MGLPGVGDRLELTYNFGVESYELGTGYGHIALTVDDLDLTLAELARGSSPSARPIPCARAAPGSASWQIRTETACSQTERRPA
jgi:hypothetical protein